jgi:hypothetical protein
LRVACRSGHLGSLMNQLLDSASADHSVLVLSHLRNYRNDNPHCQAALTAPHPFFDPVDWRNLDSLRSWGQMTGGVRLRSLPSRAFSRRGPEAWR